ncbi:stage III sporulation protein AB [Agathobaculum desmolans]|uniref:stage III sporulation protein AB n=1 Tax=Agathobaculum desmolans TaxID=39484 RepID=UPI0004E28CDF|nr:stage III sporulation protein AB [Agathobaculum desmolans]
MLKLMGAVMIFGSCAALGLTARQSLRRRVAAADSMLLALSLIVSEITCRRTPLPEIIAELAENENAAVRLLFAGLQRRLREQNGLSLSYLWRSNLRDNRTALGMGVSECDILCEAANYLGRYDASEQADGLRQVSRRLSAARAAAAEELQNKGNLYRTCGIALGILVILVLI